MPKGKIDSMKGTKRIRLAVMRKHKIGGRKSLRSATMMNNDDLRKIVAGSGLAKDKATARAELGRRGAALVLEVAEEEVAV